MKTLLILLLLVGAISLNAQPRKPFVETIVDKVFVLDSASAATDTTDGTVFITPTIKYSTDGDTLAYAWELVDLDSAKGDSAGVRFNWSNKFSSFKAVKLAYEQTFYTPGGAVGTTLGWTTLYDNNTAHAGSSTHIKNDTWLPGYLTTSYRFKLVNKELTNGNKTKLRGRLKVYLIRKWSGK